MPFPLRLPRTSALGSRPRPGPGGAPCGTGAPRLPEIQILGHRMIPLVGMSDWRALPVFCCFSERWQRTSTTYIYIYIYIYIRGCAAIRKADAAEMPKELKMIVSEDVDVTVDDYEVYGFTHGDDDVLPYTDTLEGTLISYLPIPVDGGGQPMPSQGVQSVSREQSDNCYEGVMHKARNMGSLAVKDHGILNTPPSPCLTSSSPSFPFRCSDAPPFFSPSRHDDGILPTPHFSTRLPPHSYLRRSGSSPRRSGPSHFTTHTSHSLA